MIFQYEVSLKKLKGCMSHDPGVPVSDSTVIQTIFNLKLVGRHRLIYGLFTSAYSRDYKLTIFL